MVLSQAQTSIARRLADEIPDIDKNMPVWARRTNPIVRRQLGMYWRVTPPQIRPLVKWMLILAVISLITIPLPFLFIFILTALIGGMMVLPYAFYIYARMLLHVISDATMAMIDEHQNSTMTLLRTTPFSVLEIVLSKIMASVWRRMDDLDFIMGLGVFLGLPAISIFYLNMWPPDEYPLLPQFLTVIMYFSSIVRLPLEMFMVASFGVMMGTLSPLRSTAFLASSVFVGFYFLLLNLMRFVEMNWGMQLFIDSILPLILPMLISGLAIRITIRSIKSD